MYFKEELYNKMFWIIIKYLGIYIYIIFFLEHFIT